jgi:hypothetical protein
MSEKLDHPLLAEWLHHYRKTGEVAEVTNRNTPFPLAAARAWTRFIRPPIDVVKAVRSYVTHVEKYAGNKTSKLATA